MCVPPEDGGAVERTSWPRYCPRTGGPLVHRVVRQVVQRDQPAIGLHVRDHHVRQGARVHRFGALVGNLPQRASVIASNDDLSDGRWFARRQEHFGRGREASDGSGRVADHVDQITASGEACRGEADGRLDQPGEWQPAVARHRVRPALECTGGRDGAIADTIGIAHRLVIEAARQRLIHIRRRVGRHCGVIVDEHHVASAPVTNEEESGAEWRNHHWLDDRQSKQCRHGSVHRVAAPAEHFGARRRSERMVRRDNRLRGDRLPLMGPPSRVWRGAWFRLTHHGC
jgi:hypothetical protein